MKQAIIAGKSDNPNNTGVSYAALAIGSWWYIPETLFAQVVSTSGSISHLYIRLIDGAPGDGKSYVFTLMVNGIAVALTCTISGSDTTGKDITNSVNVVAGDTVSIQCSPSGTPALSNVLWSVIFTGSISKESLILGVSDDTLNSLATEYAHIWNDGNIWTETENDKREVVATPGTIKNLYVKLSADPGTSPEAYRFTVRKNNADTILTCTITANNTTGNDTVNSFTVVAGDVLTLMCEPLNSPTVVPYAAWGVTFVADTDGESLFSCGSLSTCPTLDTRYNYLLNPNIGWNLAGRQQLISSPGASWRCIIKELNILLNGSPGVGKSYAFTVRKNQVSTDLTCTVADNNTTASDTTNQFIFGAGDTLDIMCVPSGTPTSRAAYWGAICYIKLPPLHGIFTGKWIITKA